MKKNKILNNILNKILPHNKNGNIYGDNFKKDVYVFDNKNKEENPFQNNLAQNKQNLKEHQEIINKEKNKKKQNKKFVSMENKWKAPKVLTANLVKGEITNFVSWKSQIKILIYSIISACLVVGLFYGVLLYQEKNINKQGEITKQKIKELDLNIRTAEKEIDKIKVFDRKLTYVKLLLDKHIYWSNFFDFLEKNIITDAYITGKFSSGIDEKYSFPIIAKKLSDVTNQIRIMSINKYVTDVKVESAQKLSDKDNGDGVSFNLEISLKPEIFYKYGD